jgi:hypothetical protein
MRFTGQAWPDIVCVSRTSEARGRPLKIIKSKDDSFF